MREVFRSLYANKAQKFSCRPSELFDNIYIIEAVDNFFSYPVIIVLRPRRKLGRSVKLI